MKKIKLLALVLAIIHCFALSAFAIEEINVDSEAAILIDADDGLAIYEKNPDEKKYPASLTKLMTALLVVENVSDFSEVVTANETAFSELSEAGSSVGIKPGEKMSVDNLMICMLVASANEAAAILAERVSGSVDAFVDLMNSRAAELGLSGTNFENPHGLHDESHYTTARDMAIIAREVRKYPRLCEICAMDKATIPATNISKERFFFTTNSLISLYKERGYKYNKADGMKTGSTTPAGLCLAASAVSKDTRLISIVLGAKKNEETGEKGHFVESKKLLSWGFDNFKRVTLLQASTPVTEARVELAWDRDYVVAHAERDYSALMPSDYDESKLELVPNAEEVIDAPIKKGDRVGTVTIKYDGKEYVTLALLAADDVNRSLILYIGRKISDILKSPITTIVIIALIIAIVLYIMFVIRYNRNRRRRRRRYR